MLQTFGFDVLEAANAREALALLKDPDQVEVLFTDVVMPGMNGVDLACRARECHQGISVILTSGYTAPDTAIPSDWQFIPKPYTFGDLIRALRKAR